MICDLWELENKESESVAICSKASCSFDMLYSPAVVSPMPSTVASTAEGEAVGE